jgi:hypothetical protein
LLLKEEKMLGQSNKNIYRVLGMIIVALLLLFFTLLWIGKRIEQKEISKLFKGVQAYPECCIEEKEITPLPLVVQRYFNYLQLVGSEASYKVYVKQKGIFLKYPEKKGQSFKAEQYFRGDTPAFLWKARIGSLLKVKDHYSRGEAHMDAKILEWIAVAKAQDERLNQGALARYFSEMIWFPSAYLYNEIEWEANGKNTFSGRLTYNNISVLGHFEIDDNGALIRFTTERYMEVDGKYRMENWAIEVSDYRESHGYKIPYKGKAIWLLNEGDYEYIKLEIECIQYNAEVPD